MPISHFEMSKVMAEINGATSSKVEVAAHEGIKPASKKL